MKVICEICSKSFDKKKTDIERTKHNFCSLDCYHRFHYKGISSLKWNGRRKEENNPNWKGGEKIDNKGYIRTHKPEHPFCDAQGYIFKHRLVMEKKIGRYLLLNEIVHHIDKNPLNNNINNLELFANNGEHIKYHRSIKGELLCQS
jgi:hypothetical protein